MQLDIHEIVSDVEPIPDLLRPDLLARIVDATLAEAERRKAGERQAHRETQLWSSVRAGSGR